MSGKFLYKRESRISLNLVGDNESTYWTKQALYKNGYGVESNSNYTLKIDNKSKIWELYENDGKIGDFSSIKNLINNLNKLFFPEYGD